MSLKFPHPTKSFSSSSYNKFLLNILFDKIENSVYTFIQEKRFPVRNPAYTFTQGKRFPVRIRYAEEILMAFLPKK